MPVASKGGRIGGVLVALRVLVALQDKGPPTWPERDIITDAAESGRLVASPTTLDDAVLAGGRALTGAGVSQVAAGNPNGSPDDDALM